MDTNAMNTNVDDEFMNWIQVWFDLWGGVMICIFWSFLSFKEYDNSNEKIEVLRENIGMPKKILFNDKCWKKYYFYKPNYE